MLMRYGVILGVLSLGGCINLAPDYQQPRAPLPTVWSEPVQGEGLVDIDTHWKDFLINPKLQETVKLALLNNRSLKVALLNIEQARAQYRIDRAALFPAVDAGLTGTRQKSSGSSGRSGGGSGGSYYGSSSSDGSSDSSSDSSSGSIYEYYDADVSFTSFELDLFGRLRNQRDAALEDFLATAENRRSAQISLVAEVANAWLTLAADKRKLRLAELTLVSQRQTYELVEATYALGAESGLTLAQSKSTMEAARGDVAKYRTQVEQDLNALTQLVGAPVPAHLQPDAQIDDGEVSHLVAVAPNLPSELLQRRPDVMAAEHALIAAHADIGAARAAFFPSLTLTGTWGSSSSELSDLFGSNSETWSIMPSISLPLFTAGSNQANLESAWAGQAIELANYEDALRTAFQEVADALATRARIDEQLSAQRGVTQATQKTYDLSLALYRYGSESFLELMDAQRSLYSAQQDMIDLQLSEQSNRITLYKVLGGGWQMEGDAQSLKN